MMLIAVFTCLTTNFFPSFSYNTARIIQWFRGYSTTRLQESLHV